MKYFDLLKSQRFLFILFLFLFVRNVKGSLGNPTIQSVCKIAMKDGSIVQGLITLGYGGYYGNWMNGFYLEYYPSGVNYKYEQTKFFTLRFKSFVKVDSTYDFYGKRFENCRKIKFLHWVESPTIYQPQKMFYDDNNTSDTVRLTTHLERKYVALDSITVYFEIPTGTYLYYDTIQKTKFQKIAVRDIVRFELFEKPEQKWLDMISLAEIKADELYNGKDSSGDFLAAGWYHEILKNEEWFNDLQKGIEFNIER